jgi:hypothetical protein
MAAGPRPPGRKVASVPVLSRRPTSTVPGGRAGAAGLTVAGVAALALVVGASTMLVPPAHVPAVTVANPTAWYADVSVSSGTGGWVVLGPVAPGESRRLADVLDVGDSWAFRFTYGDGVEAVATFDRAELAQSSWEVTVPEEFSQQAQEAGLVPSHVDD